MKLHSIRYLLREGIRNIWCNRMMSVASFGVLISCLLLTGSAVLFSMNISSAMTSIEGENSIKVYLTQDLPTVDVQAAGEKIQAIANVKTCEFVQKDQGLKELLERMGDDGTIFDGLEGDDNFLPDAYKISLSDISRYDETITEIKEIYGVDRITDYSDIAAKLSSLDKLIGTAGFWIVLILSIVSLFIIANTIRVTMYSRRMEISIMKSVGATNGFIRLPFIMEGVVIGLFSGLIASILLFVVYAAMGNAVSSIVPFFTVIPLSRIILPVLGLFFLAGCMFGGVGGMLSITRYLKKEGGDIIAW